MKVRTVSDPTGNLATSNAMRKGRMAEGPIPSIDHESNVDIIASMERELSERIGRKFRDWQYQERKRGTSIGNNSRYFEALEECFEWHLAPSRDHVLTYQMVNGEMRLGFYVVDEDYDAITKLLSEIA